MATNVNHNQKRKIVKRPSENVGKSSNNSLYKLLMKIFKFFGALITI